MAHSFNLSIWVSIAFASLVLDYKNLTTLPDFQTFPGHHKYVLILANLMHMKHETPNKWQYCNLYLAVTVVISVKPPFRQHILKDTLPI